MSQVLRRISVVLCGICAIASTVTAWAAPLDVYNTILSAMDVKQRMGPEKRKMRMIDVIRA